MQTVREDLSNRLNACDFTSRNDLLAFLAITSDWLIIFFLAQLSEFSNCFAVTICCWIMIGYFQFALGEAIVHDASHRNLFRVPEWHDRLDFLYALPFFMTIRQWRKEHNNHHQNFGSIDDHIVADYVSFGLTSSSNPNLYWICFCRPLLGLCLVGRIRWIIETATRTDWQRMFFFWLPIVILSVSYGFLYQIFLYWFIPLLFVFPVFLYWSEIGDHYRARSGTRSRTGICYNLFWHNNGYHAVHHRYPRIPFHQLARAHRSLAFDNTDAVTGWVGTWQSISSQLDDPPAGEMVFRPATEHYLDKNCDLE